jgi:hypothetical protein
MHLLGLAQPLDGEPVDEAVEDAAMQFVKNHPALAAAPHLFHGRLIARPPGVRKCLPVDIDAFLCAKRPSLADQARAPVHDSAEHVEAERFHSI